MPIEISFSAKLTQPVVKEGLPQPTFLCVWLEEAPMLGPCLLWDSIFR